LLGRLDGAGAGALASPSFTFHSGDVNRAPMDRVVDTIRLWVPAAGLSPARLIAQRDEECGHVLAVPAVARGERRTRTARNEAGRSELQRHPIRFGFGPPHVPSCTSVLDDDVFDRMPTHVVVTAQVRTRPEETP
jgi:hypothetical protein